MKKMEQAFFKKEVRGWGKSRGIYAESTWQKQLEYYYSERAELIYAETDLDRFDAFGDMLVCLVHCEMLGPEPLESCPLRHLITTEQFLACRDFSTAFDCAIGEIKRAGFDPEECMYQAWEGQNSDGIKYRTGLMVKGKFVKWANLSHSERLLVAKSGQLTQGYVDLGYHKSLCTDDEWREIQAVEYAALNS